MNKYEFIEGLRKSLSAVNDYTFVNDTITYYENYIDTQMRMGRTERDVMEELGDPRLIAKSIKATHTMEETQEYSRDVYQDYHNEYRNGKKARFIFNGREFSLPSWLVKTVTVVILAIAFFLVFTVLRWLSPFIFTGVILYLVLKRFFGKY